MMRILRVSCRPFLQRLSTLFKNGPRKSLFEWPSAPRSSSLYAPDIFSQASMQYLEKTLRTQILTVPLEHSNLSRSWLTRLTHHLSNSEPARWPPSPSSDQPPKNWSQNFYQASIQFSKTLGLKEQMNRKRWNNER